MCPHWAGERNVFAKYHNVYKVLMRLVWPWDRALNAPPWMIKGGMLPLSLGSIEEALPILFHGPHTYSLRKQNQFINRFRFKCNSFTIALYFFCFIFKVVKQQTKYIETLLKLKYTRVFGCHKGSQSVFCRSVTYSKSLFWLKIEWTAEIHSAWGTSSLWWLHYLEIWSVCFFGWRVECLSDCVIMLSCLPRSHSWLFGDHIAVLPVWRGFRL